MKNFQGNTNPPPPPKVKDKEGEYTDMEGFCTVGNTRHKTTRLKVIEHIADLASLDVNQDSEVIYHQNYSISFDMRYRCRKGKNHVFRGTFIPIEL